MEDQYTKYWELFIKQKDGKISVTEREALDTWRNNHPEAFNELEELYKASDDTKSAPSFDPNDQWEELKTIIKIEKEAQGSPMIRIFPWIARIAAAVILVIGFTYLFYQYQGTFSDDLNIQAIVQTYNAEQKEVELPDGTRVYLNKNSELLYPEEFETNNRTVYLKGEAFFDVTSDPEKPFTIYSGISKTTVLGTSFNLRAYSKEDEVKLTVVTGKVAFTLADDKEKVVVTPGNMALLKNASKSIIKGSNTDLNFLSWKTNYLTFDDNSIQELISSLERHYDIQISVANPKTLDCRFTGDFQDTDLENAIKIITRATGTTYEVSEGQYIIEGAGCN